MKTNKKKIVLIISIFFLSILVAFKAPQGQKLFEIAKNLDIFASLFKEISIYYVDEVNSSELIKKGINAMLEDLDPYTNYIPEEDLEEYKTLTTGEYGGIGAVVGKRNDKVIISMPYKGFPAQKAGLEIGDEILKIESVDLKGKNTGDVSKLLKGQINTPVKLTIRKGGSQEIKEVTIIREKIKLNDVPYLGMVAKEVGYIKLIDFRLSASKELKNGIIELKKQGAQKIILDLRDNPGGLLTEAVNVVSIFLPKGSEVVNTKGRITELNKIYNTLNSPVDPEIPLAVLVDGQSASSSEIVCGSIQDYDRGVLIGEKTYGKGLVQITRPLSYNAQLKITTQRYYIPSGRCIQAIDYKNKNGEGIAQRIADSLRIAYKTKNGRTVYDVGGVTPDVELSRQILAPITVSLFTKGLFFDYATDYKHRIKTIASAKTFKLTDNEYQQFIKWLQTKEYDYTTEVEKTIDEIEKEAKKEKYTESIQEQIKNLKLKIAHNKEKDLDRFKEEIKQMLEQEIVSRYYLEEGMIEHFFQYDKDLKSAVEVLNNPSTYKQLLTKK